MTISTFCWSLFVYPSFLKIVREYLLHPALLGSAPKTVSFILSQSPSIIEITLPVRSAKRIINHLLYGLPRGLIVNCNKFLPSLGCRSSAVYLCVCRSSPIKSTDLEVFISRCLAFNLSLLSHHELWNWSLFCPAAILGLVI